MQHSESTEVAETGDASPNAGLELELEGIAENLSSKWRDRGQEFARWLLQDIRQLQRVGDIQLALWPEETTDVNLRSFLVERCNYSPAFANFLMTFRRTVAQLPDGYIPSLNPHMVETLAKIPEKFLPGVLRGEELYIGLPYWELPITSKGANNPSLTKFVQQLRDRLNHKEQPEIRLAQRMDADSEDALMREELEAVDQPRLIEDAAPTPAASFAPTAITNGLTLIQHLRPVWKAWPVIQKSVIDDICEGRVSREDTVEACDIGLKLFKALKQYAQQAQ